MDNLDRQLISLLRKDGRAALSDAALALGVSRATVRSRLERLQQSGEVVGFTVITKGDRDRAPVRGLMLIGIEGRGADRIIRQLRGLPDVTEIHTTNGKWDLILHIGAETLEEFDRTLTLIRRIDGVTTSETNLMLATKATA